MSLINQVLKDLEKTKKNNRSIPHDMAGLLVEGQRNPMHLTAKLGTFVVLLAIALLIWGLWDTATNSRFHHEVRAKKNQIAISPTIYHAPSAVTVPKETTSPLALSTKQAVALVHWKQFPHPQIPAPTTGYMHIAKAASTKTYFVDVAYQQALNELANGQTSTAIAHLQALVRNTPNYYPARQQLVNLLIDQKRYVEAEYWIKGAPASFTNHLHELQLQARLLLAKGQPQQALTILQQQTPALGSDPGYYLLLAETERQLGNLAVAASIYEQLLQFDPTQSNWWVGLGIVFEQAGKSSLAVEAYQRALAAGQLPIDLQLYAEDRLQRLKGFQ